MQAQQRSVFVMFTELVEHLVNVDIYIILKSIACRPVETRILEMQNCKCQTSL
jgi:hypothetical protein